jgi:four helix bundle protein
MVLRVLNGETFLKDREVTMGQFGHRSLRVYSAALDAYSRALRTVQSDRKAAGWVESQLLRAIASVALNIAEGVAEFSAGDKARFYRLARRSAAEAGAAIDLLAREGRIAKEDADGENQKLGGIAAMLTVMIHKARATGPATPPSEPVDPAVPGPGHGLIASRAPASRNQKPAPESSPRNGP